MKKPRIPIKPYLSFPAPRKPQKTLPSWYAPRNSFEDSSFSLADILEKIKGVDPKDVEFSTHEESYDVKVTWPKPDALPLENPRYEQEMKSYEKNLIDYDNAKAKYEADNIIYQKKLKKYEEDDKAYKIWFYEKELKKLKNEKLSINK